ncbi:MAG: cytochrome c [Alphaproteobacteria bacterium]|nr:cytochrome c [Alphaproteobacteria bacterium]MBV9554118.1 cytochrome c [Alphaproteobacteria bacterium]
MNVKTKAIAPWAAALAIAVCAGVAQADDAAAIEARQAHMKAQSKDLGAIKAFTEDKGELAAAQAASADLVKRIAQIPDLAPKGTGMDAYPDKSYAKPAIWSEWDKFVAADKSAVAAAQALDTAVKGGDKAAITAAYGNMTRDFWGTASSNPGACGGCHGAFAQKKPS